MKILRALNFARKKEIYYFSFLACVLLLTGWASTASAAVSNIKSEIETLKVAFTFNFPKFVTWDDQSHFNQNDQFGLCFIAENILSNKLQELEGKTISGKTVHLINMEGSSTEEIVESCLLLFVDSENFSESEALLSELSNRDVLTVSDQAGSSNQGAAMELFTVDSKLAFRINSQLLSSKGLFASAQLQNLAIP